MVVTKDLAGSMKRVAARLARESLLACLICVRKQHLLRQLALVRHVVAPAETRGESGGDIFDGRRCNTIHLAIVAHNVV